MDSAKFQSDIIHDIEMACECVVFSQNGYIFVHGLAACHNTEITTTFLESNEIPILEWPDINPIENVSNIMQKEIGNQMHVKKEDMWKRVCEVWYSVTPNVLEELFNSMQRKIAALIKPIGVHVCCCVFN